MDSSLDSCSAASELSSSVLVLLSSIITPSINNFPCFCHYLYPHRCPLHVLATLSSMLPLTSKLVCVRYSAEITLNRLDYIGVLDEWCTEWGMKVNADKCGVMHIRRRGVTTSAFSAGGGLVRVVQSYKYIYSYRMHS